jgi:hypothetical protein
MPPPSLKDSQAASWQSSPALGLHGPSARETGSAEDAPLFPCLVISMANLLAMLRLESYETLRQKGKLVEYDPVSMPTVIFVSQ